MIRGGFAIAVALGIHFLFFLLPISFVSSFHATPAVKTPPRLALALKHAPFSKPVRSPSVKDEVRQSFEQEEKPAATAMISPAAKKVVSGNTGKRAEAPEVPVASPKAEKSGEGALETALPVLPSDPIPFSQNNVFPGKDETFSEINSAPPMIQATPLYEKNPLPPYPRIARRRGQEGTVFLEVFVSEKGLVSDVRIGASSGYESLDQAAVNGVRQWLFTPGMQGGGPVSMWVNVPVRFKLEGER